MDKNTIERFWSKVDCRSENECWPWRRGKSYPQFRIGKKLVRGNRFAMEITAGVIPNGLQVLHLCDNPKCVNPRHLFLGTNDDNIRDKVNKNRQRCGTGRRHGSKTHPERISRGSNQPAAKLTETNVPEIRRIYATGRYSQAEIGKKFAVDQSIVSEVVNRKIWKHV